jgi:L-asparaginase/Glu-tRNA(Gln) amidotransferase subunit D
MNTSLSLSTSDLVELDKKIEITKVLIIYTGGTIGMKTSKQGFPSFLTFHKVTFLNLDIYQNN